MPPDLKLCLLPTHFAMCLCSYYDKQPLFLNTSLTDRLPLCVSCEKRDDGIYRVFHDFRA